MIELKGKGAKRLAYKNEFETVYENDKTALRQYKHLLCRWAIDRYGYAGNDYRFL